MPLQANCIQPQGKAVAIFEPLTPEEQAHGQDVAESAQFRHRDPVGDGIELAVAAQHLYVGPIGHDVLAKGQVLVEDDVDDRLL